MGTHRLVRFSGIVVNGSLRPGLVSDFNSDTSGCRNDDGLIEAANALALEQINTSRTDETPNCIDAGIRIQAYIEHGMTVELARSIVGKPIETSVAGTFWDYGRRSNTPQIRFTGIVEAGALRPGVVSDFDSDISGCQ